MPAKGNGVQPPAPDAKRRAPRLVHVHLLFGATVYREGFIGSGDKALIIHIIPWALKKKPWFGHLCHDDAAQTLKYIQPNVIHLCGVSVSGMARRWAGGWREGRGAKGGRM